ncbi:hypothetical protein ABZ752_03845 [Streptomyces roseifaciens]
MPSLSRSASRLFGAAASAVREILGERRYSSRMLAFGVVADRLGGCRVMLAGAGLR